MSEKRQTNLYLLTATRAAAEQVLQPYESLSSFVDAAMQAEVQRRQRRAGARQKSRRRPQLAGVG